MVSLKVVQFTGTFKWNKPVEPEPPAKNSPTHIQLLKCYIQVHVITTIDIYI